MNKEVLQRISEDRHELHSSHKSSRPLSEDYELVGIGGEWAFALETGYMPDFSKRPSGDNGKDFTVPVVCRDNVIRFKDVDVKTARKPGNLIHEQGKPFVDVYVLAGWDDAIKEASLLGWSTGPELQSTPVRDFGHGIENHYIPASQLRSMSVLLSRIIKYSDLPSCNITSCP